MDTNSQNTNSIEHRISLGRPQSILLALTRSASPRQQEGPTSDRQVDPIGFKSTKAMKMFRNRDHDDDVDMTVPQPIYEFVQAPRLTGWDQPTVSEWLKARQRYETKMRERCAVTGEDYDALVTPATNSVVPQILEKLARYILKLAVDEVNDEILIREAKRRCSSLRNGHVPDLDRLFKTQLKMDLKEDDTEARILNYFVLFDKIIEDNGLDAPEILRVEIERLAMANPMIKKNDMVLFDVLVERAREQQHYHMLNQELKGLEKTRSKGNDKEQPPQKNHKKAEHGARQHDREPRAGVKTETVSKTARRDERSREPPRDGCLFCGKAHWVSECPTASNQEKREALERVSQSKGKRVNAKKAKSLVTNGERAAIVNGVLEVPFRADTGADCNVISRHVVNELKELGCTK